MDNATSLNDTRLVIDSITAFSFWMDDPAKIRYAIYKLIEELRKLKCTCILTCETAGGRHDISRFGVEEFLSDGVLQLFFKPPHRSIFVRKMRGTKNDMRIHPFEITDKGITVKPEEEVLWESLK